MIVLSACEIGLLAKVVKSFGSVCTHIKAVAGKCYSDRPMAFQGRLCKLDGLGGRAREKSDFDVGRVCNLPFCTCFWQVENLPHDVC